MTRFGNPATAAVFVGLFADGVVQYIRRRLKRTRGKRNRAYGREGK
jgi:hypothetical protein